MQIFSASLNGVLAKDAGIADSMEKIEESLQKAHSIDNIWRGLLNLSGLQPGSQRDAEWQNLAIRAIEKPKKLAEFKDKVTAALGSQSARRIGVILVEKIVEIGVKTALGR